jgi:cellulose synthase/poly-beta-1,6-N-acetylglucosamine synthase-like glycosyltransferase
MMLRETAVSALAVFSVAVIVYFALWNASQMAMSPIALLFLGRHRVRHRRHARALVAHLTSPPLVSVIVPAYNEELTIVESVRALLLLDYAAREIIVVNDGSSDGTLAALADTFQLVPAPAAFAQP